ncbi:aspartate ammonia-lyase [Lysobacteraceae bacterium NML08-0793]|nr:aspartate ammonia-lyase [Xanthomonadaceae bacterium NML08-0793]
MSEFRLEHDSMGTLQVPANALWGAQTQRAVDNFPVSGLRMHPAFIRALGAVKASAAEVNTALGLLDAARGEAIVRAAEALAAGQYADAFPLDRFQTGSGTSTNMNANEVIAHLASRAALAVHPNDHVNLGQSSNDVIPSTMRVAAQQMMARELLPALQYLRTQIAGRAEGLGQVVKTGRTHLMDAMPLTLAQEFSAWEAQLASAQSRIQDSMQRVARLPIGGTAIGSGINAHPEFAERVCQTLSQRLDAHFVASNDKFEGIAAQDDLVELSGQLSALAVALTKIANDLRWMNSGPLAGLGEVELPALQPGSSIMPGKVNPVICESLLMVCAQVIGLHIANTVAGASGNFQLNVMLPLLANNLLDAGQWLANGMRLLADKVIVGLRVREDVIAGALARNPILVTALNPVIGYEKAAAIAKRAYAEGRPVLDVAIEDSGLEREQLERLLDPLLLTRGGIHTGSSAGG